MKAHAIPILLVALLLAVGATARAQEAEEAKPERPPPTAGALPVEDPTIHQERKTGLIEGQQEEPTAQPEPPKPDDPGAAGDDEADGEEEAQQTVGALPVEDPTLDPPA